jgi:hypothetical protein
MDGWVVFGTRLDTKDFDKQIGEVEYELEQVEYELSKKKELKLDDRTINEYESKAEKLRNKIIDLKKRQDDLNNTKLSDVTKSVDNVGNSVSKVIKKIGKWALAVFSVRSAYTLISRSVSTLSQYNDQIKTDIQYIGFAIATALQPVVEYLISLVYKLLKAINSIAISWFGVNLFAKATAENMNKGVKSAEKMKKALAGFDEMNVLQDTSSSGGVGGGTTAPSVDLSKTDVKGAEEVKNFWKDIKQLYEEDINDIINSIEGNWDWLLKGFLMLGQGIYYIFKGVIDIIVGLFKLLVAFFKGDLEGIKDAWDKTWNGILDLLWGILETIISVVMMALGIVKGIFLDLVNGIWNLVIKPIGNFFVGLWEGIIDGVKNAVKWVKDTFKSIVSFFSGIIDKILGFFKKLGTNVGDAIGGAFKAVVNGVLGAIEKILNAPIKTINSLIKTINKVPGINLSTLGTFKLPRLAVGGIVNMPGRGVPVGGAIAGEVSKEGVLPLTDSQAMEELGATIGRYITINANITNTMNGRVISRELQKINTNSDFARNG